MPSMALRWTCVPWLHPFLTFLQAGLELQSMPPTLTTRQGEAHCGLKSRACVHCSWAGQPSQPSCPPSHNSSSDFIRTVPAQSNHSSSRAHLEEQRELGISQTHCTRSQKASPLSSCAVMAKKRKLRTIHCVLRHLNLSLEV